jgi:hypothetical protein
LKIIDRTHDFEIIGVDMMKHHFQWLGKMIPIRDHHFWIVRIDRNDNRFVIGKIVDLCTVDHSPYLKKTQQEVALAGNNDMICFGNSLFI